MGNCIYCGQKAGVFRTSHKECKEKHESGKNQIVNLVCESTLSELDVGTLRKQIHEIAETCYIEEVRTRELTILGWEDAVNKALDDNVLSTDEERKLAEARDKLSLSQSDLDERGSYTRVVQSSVLREVLEGKIPEKVTIDGQLPFNFQKGEKLVWLFHNVRYYEQKTKKEFVGGHHGVSIRLARGLYYRVGAFKGQPVLTTETVHLDTGVLGLTNKHLYFAGTNKSFRIKYDKVVSFSPYSDGIGVQRDAATAKPQSFVTGDGWFIYNLVTNLASM